MLCVRHLCRAYINVDPGNSISYGRFISLPEREIAHEPAILHRSLHPEPCGQGARTALPNSWLILTADRAPTYQPELHYMRGPGPKVAGKTRARSWHRWACAYVLAPQTRR